jgi:predicted metalloprotease
MKWQGRRASSHVEDRRGMGGGSRRMAGGVGVGAIILLIMIALLGGNPTDLLNNILSPAVVETTSCISSSEEQELADFSAVVLAETEDVWANLFAEAGYTYQYPALVLSAGVVESACGAADSSTGPFYCPGDQKIYIDLSFFMDLKTKFKAPGDFAMAYVIAHEVGHHVQYQLGITEEVFALQSKLSRAEFNEYLVRLELQADYFAGVWAHYADRMNLLDEGDLNEALTAAGAAGDDRIQYEARGYVIPDSFTHGTSEQRSRWFKKGFDHGTIEGGDTFNLDFAQLWYQMPRRSANYKHFENIAKCSS